MHVGSFDALPAESVALGLTLPTDATLGTTRDTSLSIGWEGTEPDYAGEASEELPLALGHQPPRDRSARRGPGAHRRAVAHVQHQARVDAILAGVRRACGDPRLGPRALAGPHLRRLPARSKRVGGQHLHRRPEHCQPRRARWTPRGDRRPDPFRGDRRRRARSTTSSWAPTTGRRSTRAWLPAATRTRQRFAVRPLRAGGRWRASSPAHRPAPLSHGNSTALPEKGVTLHSGHIGDTSGLCRYGRAKCLGRSVTRWMNDFGSSLACSKARKWRFCAGNSISRARPATRSRPYVGPR